MKTDAFLFRRTRDSVLLKTSWTDGVLFLLFYCGLCNTALAEPAFEGVIASNSGYQFIVSEVNDTGGPERVVSPFIRVDGEFRGWILKEYLKEKDALVVESVVGGRRVLHLKNAKVKREAEALREKDISKLFGMELAMELAKRGDERIKGKLEAIEKLFGFEIDQQENIERLSARFDELEKKYPDDAESRVKISKHKEGIENLRQGYVRLVKSHVLLEQQIESEVNNKIHGGRPRDKTSQAQEK